MNQMFTLPRPTFNERHPIYTKQIKLIDKKELYDGEELQLGEDDFFKCKEDEVINFDVEYKEHESALYTLQKWQIERNPNFEADLQRYYSLKKTFDDQVKEWEQQKANHQKIENERSEYERYLTLHAKYKDKKVPNMK